MAKVRKRKRFRPKKLFKRLFMLAVLAAFIWALTFAARGAYRYTASLFAADKYVRTAEVKQVPDTSGIAAQAVVLRQETVILADKPGKANPLVAEGADVTTGQRVVELVDKSLLASIEEGLAKLDQQSATKPDDTGATQLAQLDQKLLQAETALQALMDDYRAALNDRAVSKYRELYSSLNSRGKEVAKLQQDRLLLLQSENSVEEQRAELESRREQAVVPVFSPASGRISFQVDGLEQMANLANLNPSLFTNLKETKITNYTVAAETAIDAGQPVFKVSTGRDTHLLVNLPAGALATIQGWSELAVQVNTVGAAGDWPATLQPSQQLGGEQCLLKIELPPETEMPRFLDVTLHTKGEVLCQIPKGALVNGEASSQVFLLDGTVVKAQTVVVRETGKSSVVVTGLNPGATVVTNPAGLTDGEDVSSRLRK